MRLFFAPFLFLFFSLPCSQAQDTLPGFSAILKSNGKVLISWRNSYPAVNQISIQRSNDSLRNFTTMVTVPDPRIPENGFVDNKASGKKLFYRIFILFPNSKYLFTKSRRAVDEQIDRSAKTLNPGPNDKSRSIGDQTIKNDTQAPVDQTITQPVHPVEEEEKYLVLPKIDNARIFYMMENPAAQKPLVNNPGKIRTQTIEVEKILFIKKRDSLIMKVSGSQVRRFSDSLVKQTKDTLIFLNADTLQINPYVETYKEPKEVYKISPYVFTSKDGNVNIALADFSRKKYYVAFYETDNTPVLEVKDIRDAMLIIDKTSFGHSGWFRFELYEDGKLMEKNKILIPRE